LLEGLVFGQRTAVAAAAYIPEQRACRASNPEAGVRVTYDVGGPRLEDLKKKIRTISWECAGIIRCIESLGRARRSLSELSNIIDFNCETRACIELRNILTVATLITEAALLREGSIGAHYRSDFPLRGSDWQRHTNISKQGREMIRRWT
jgi:L-aspartate oxidase